VTTERKITANRQNALQSTGPRTAEGKRISSQNATRLGIFCQQVLLDDEDPGELQLLARAIRADLEPSGPMELSVVDLTISVLWHLRRLLRIETGIYRLYEVYKGVNGGAPVAFAHDASQLDCLSRVARMETTLERRLHKALHELRTLQTRRAGRAQQDAAIEVDVRPANDDQEGGGRSRWIESDALPLINSDQP